MGQDGRWSKAQDWETHWWGSCVNTYGEEEKQLTYANRMGLPFFHNRKSPYNIDVKGKSIVDLGGGPTSLLLKCVNLSHGVVVDPLPVPSWVIDRYEANGIEYMEEKAEDTPSILESTNEFDEAWIYNCLQHTEDPGLIVSSVKSAVRIIRIFEWLDTSVNIGHPHAFTSEVLDKMLGGEGKVEELRTPTLTGKCYYGIFAGLA